MIRKPVFSANCSIILGECFLKFRDILLPVHKAQFLIVKTSKTIIKHEDSENVVLTIAAKHILIGNFKR